MCHNLPNNFYDQLTFEQIVDRGEFNYNDNGATWYLYFNTTELAPDRNRNRRATINLITLAWRTNNGRCNINVDIYPPGDSFCTIKQSNNPLHAYQINFNNIQVREGCPNCMWIEELQIREMGGAGQGQVFRFVFNEYRCEYDECEERMRRQGGRGGARKSRKNRKSKRATRKH